MISDDMELVREYAACQSERAFAALVSRHAGLVYSTALRQVSHPQLAEEVSQVVFIILARKAGLLSSKTILSGWLYRTACFVSKSALKSELRRQQREQEAYMESALHESTVDSTWEQLSPLLDEAMLRLGQADRDALVLRFFEGRTLNEVGAALGASEDAAKKRVNRAVEKLHKYFSRRGVVLTTAIIAGTISTKSIQAAPALMTNSIVTAVIYQGATAGSSTASIIKGALKIMAWSKAKTAIVAGLAVLLTAAAATITLDQIIPPSAPVIRIEGTAQVELYTAPIMWPSQNLNTNDAQQRELYYPRKLTTRVVETARMVIVTDGKSYRISEKSESGGLLKSNEYHAARELGSDGVDTFEISDWTTVQHRPSESGHAFADSGRFPAQELSVFPVQIAWLGYCSRDYFGASSNQTGLKIGSQWSYLWPDGVTNQAVYWPDATLPESITGWSRNWVVFPRTNSTDPINLIELKQYPAGFKAWTFTASDPVLIGKIRVPRKIEWETFFPKPPNTATTGDDTEPLRKITFVADLIEAGKGKFVPLPPVTVPSMRVTDSRFENMAGNFVITSYANPNGWPTRGSKAFRQAAEQADRVVSQNRDLIQADRVLVIPP